MGGLLVLAFTSGLPVGPKSMGITKFRQPALLGAGAIASLSIHIDEPSSWFCCGFFSGCPNLFPIILIN